MEKKTFLRRFEEICKRFDDYYKKKFNSEGSYPFFKFPAEVLNDRLESLLTEDRHKER